MIVGDPSIFALESEFLYALENPSLRGLGFFVIHISDCCFGVKSTDATVLANSFDEVSLRNSNRGQHVAPFAQEDAFEVASAFTEAIYLDHPPTLFFGKTKNEFTNIIYSNRLRWAPDGDEAFDDGSSVLQFDVDERVRLIGFKRAGELLDQASVRDVWLSGDAYYEALRKWRDGFLAEWKRLPKR